MISPLHIAAITIALTTSAVCAGTDEPIEKLVASPLRAGVATTKHITQLHIDPELLQITREVAETHTQFRIGAFPIPGNESVELILQPITVFAPD